MSDALRERPALKEILPAFHPAFEKLRHPVLGKVLPRLVCVEDAARIAGVDPDAMLTVMNLPGPPAHPAVSAERVSQPRPPWLTGAPVRTLDVRAAITAGEEPFAPIMAAFRELAPGAVLEVVAPFEPAPLLRLMGERGWRTHLAFEEDACHASFWRPPEERDGAADPGERLTRGETGWQLDLRGLAPPEPLRMALAALDRPDALPLEILHHREPALLYPRLEERGLTWTVRQVGDDVRIVVDAR